MSIKESIHVKNLDSTAGYAQKINNPSDANSVSVDQLIRLGAVPFVHTNIPIALLSYGCSNGVYGTTLNPLDNSRLELKTFWKKKTILAIFFVSNIQILNIFQNNVKIRV